MHDDKCKAEHSHIAVSIFRMRAESSSNLWVEFLVIWMQLHSGLGSTRRLSDLSKILNSVTRFHHPRIMIVPETYGDRFLTQISPSICLYLSSDVPHGMYQAPITFREAAVA
jgi:hypothetical protein